MKIAILLDSSPCSEQAFNKALAMAKPDDELFIVHSCEISTTDLTLSSYGAAWGDTKLVDECRSVLEARAHTICQPHVKLASEKGFTNVSAVVLTSINAKTAVCDFVASEHIDTLFCGSRGLSPIKRMVLGSFSQTMVHKAHCDVVICHQRE